MLCDATLPGQLQQQPSGVMNRNEGPVPGAGGPVSPLQPPAGEWYNYRTSTSEEGSLELSTNDDHVLVGWYEEL